MGVVREPGHWSRDEVQAFVQALQRGSGTRRCASHHTQAIRLRHVDGGRIVTDVLANAGTITMEPLAVSALAVAWLKEAQFEMRCCSRCSWRPSRECRGGGADRAPLVAALVVQQAGPDAVHP
jgi:hypothetical protein